MTMRDDADSAELRSLQARAYSRDGGLTAAEAARLAELEDRRRQSTEHADAPSTTARTPSSAVVDRADVPAVSVASTHGPAMPAANQEAEAPGAQSPVQGPGAGAKDWLVRAAAAVVILALGVAVGWILFGLDGDDTALPLTAAQQERRDELAAEGDYDPGSLRAIDEEDEVLVWLATENEGERVCVILDPGADATAEANGTCDPIERAREVGISADLTIPLQGNNSRYWWVTVFFARDDAPAVLINSSVEETVTREDRTDAEQRMADEITALGHDADALEIVGYRNEDPLWVANDDDEICLIAVIDDQAPEVDCTTWDEWFDGDAVSILLVEYVDGEATSADEITYREKSSGTPSLEVSNVPHQGLDDLDPIDGDDGVSGDPIPIEPSGG
ncbi:MAG: hypothetical protein ACQEW8_07550 [Actinomycetota bacterium]